MGRPYLRAKSHRTTNRGARPVGGGFLPASKTRHIAVATTECQHCRGDAAVTSVGRAVIRPRPGPANPPARAQINRAPAPSRVREKIAGPMHREAFANQGDLIDYAEAHDLAYA